MTNAEREYELEQAVRLLGEYMREVRMFGYADVYQREALYVEDLRRVVAEAKQRVAELLARDPEIAGAPADPESTALR